MSSPLVDVSGSMPTIGSLVSEAAGAAAQGWRDRERERIEGNEDEDDAIRRTDDYASIGYGAVVTPWNVLAVENQRSQQRREYREFLLSHARGRQEREDRVASSAISVAAPAAAAAGNILKGISSNPASPPEEEITGDWARFGTTTADGDTLTTVVENVGKKSTAQLINEVSVDQMVSRVMGKFDLVSKAHGDKLKNEQKNFEQWQEIQKLRLQLKAAMDLLRENSIEFDLESLGSENGKVTVFTDGGCQVNPSELAPFEPRTPDGSPPSTPLPLLVSGIDTHRVPPAVLRTVGTGPSFIQIDQFLGHLPCYSYRAGGRWGAGYYRTDGDPMLKGDQNPEFVPFTDDLDHTDPSQEIPGYKYQLEGLRGPGYYRAQDPQPRYAAAVATGNSANVARSAPGPPLPAANANSRVSVNAVLRGEFIPSDSFYGSRDGYVFQLGEHGLGYYLDPAGYAQ